MERYKIGDLLVDMNADCERLRRLGKPYLSAQKGPADITVSIPPEKMEILVDRYPHLDPDEVAYLATGSVFYRKLTLFNGLMLHASAFSMYGRGYMFSAPSGTGKSTHTGLWRQEFHEAVQMVNDDKPIIRKLNGVYHLCGTPWSGKTDLNQNLSVPLEAIVFINRAAHNSIMRADPSKMVPQFYTQTVKPGSAAMTEAMLSTVDEILTKVPVYTLRCNMEPDAVYTAYNAIVPKK